MFIVISTFLPLSRLDRYNRRIFRQRRLLERIFAAQFDLLRLNTVRWVGRKRRQGPYRLDLDTKHQSGARDPEQPIPFEEIELIVIDRCDRLDAIGKLSNCGRFACREKKLSVTKSVSRRNFSAFPPPPKGLLGGPAVTLQVRRLEVFYTVDDDGMRRMLRLRTVSPFGGEKIPPRSRLAAA